MFLNRQNDLTAYFVPRGRPVEQPVDSADWSEVPPGSVCWEAHMARLVHKDRLVHRVEDMAAIHMGTSGAAPVDTSQCGLSAMDDWKS